MIKVSEIAEKYKDYEVDEKELEKLLVKPKPKSFWDLKDGDKYWFISAFDSNAKNATWDGSVWANYRRDYGNCFSTKEEAEFELERRKCEAIMLKYGTRDMMSLGDEKTGKWCIGFIHDEEKIFCLDFNDINRQGTIWFASKEIAQQCIDEIGEDRLKKYIFNVKE